MLKNATELSTIEPDLPVHRGGSDVRRSGVRHWFRISLFFAGDRPHEVTVFLQDGIRSLAIGSTGHASLIGMRGSLRVTESRPE